MLRTDEITFRTLYEKLTEEDKNDFKSFIIHNTTLMHEFCKKTGHNLEYPYVDENEVPLKDPVPLKTINLELLKKEIKDYIMDITQEKEPRETQVPPQSNSRLLPPPPPNSILLPPPPPNSKLLPQPPKPPQLHHSKLLHQPGYSKSTINLVHFAASDASAAVAGQRRQNKKFRTQRRQKPLVRRINSRRRQPNYKFKTQRRQKPRKTQVRHKIKNKKP
jgi:hypothetical protein